jgi:hypothetical protein
MKPTDQIMENKIKTASFITPLHIQNAHFVGSYE